MSRPDYLNSEKTPSSAAPVELMSDERSSFSMTSDANKVLRNTYGLLSLTLLFSALCAGLSMAFGVPSMGPWITLGGYFVLLFAVEKTKNSGMGILFTFALTGFMGVTIAPLLASVMTISNGAQLIMTSLAATGGIFLAMSAWILKTGRDLSGMGKTLMIGVLIAFVMGIANIFFQLPGLQMAVASMFVILSSLMLAYQTSAIVNGGETNYVSATVTLFVSLYNVFISLLQLFTAFGSDD